ncbi:MAG: gliding motility protein GldM [Cyclobacteriaceae bacterium]|jgi:gliding motility-associated protein GldM
MAGGKETPRQKMIGMMYLVLTALLALQVSNSVLEKFIFINKSFEATNDEKVVENKGKIESIQTTVSESGNREADLQVVDKAKRIREETAAVLEELEGYKNQLIEMTGGPDENGSYVGQKDIDAPSALMVNAGEGDKLRDRLNGYADFVREITGDESIGKIAKDANEIDVFKSDPNQAAKGFAELNFGSSTPMVGALASLSQMQNDVISVETKALEDLARQVGAEDMKFDVIVPMVLPESKVVAPGTKYEAALFLAASSSAVTPTMTIDGEEIEVVDGRGQVSFTATPGAYNSEGIATKSFISAISVSLPGGRDTTFLDTMEYFVVKPVIQIQSQSIGALYLNCGNELDVQVPQLGTSYNPTFGVTGGVSVAGSQRGQVTIIPKSAKVTLSVSSNGNLIGTQDFKVQRIPGPEIKAKLRNRDIDGKTGMPANTPGIQLVAEPDESFAQFLPKDARFQVAQAEVTLVRGGRGGPSQRINGPNVDLRQISSQARSGDNLVIEIKSVRRANFRDEVEDFNNFGPKYITIPLK